jgi:hypothetical protein
MKKILFFSTGIAMFLFLVYSCQKDAVVATQKQSQPNVVEASKIATTEINSTDSKTTTTMLKTPDLKNFITNIPKENSKQTSKQQQPTANESGSSSLEAGWPCVLHLTIEATAGEYGAVVSLFDGGTSLINKNGYVISPSSTGYSYDETFTLSGNGVSAANSFISIHNANSQANTAPQLYQTFFGYANVINGSNSNTITKFNPDDFDINPNNPTIAGGAPFPWIGDGTGEQISITATIHTLGNKTKDELHYEMGQKFVTGQVNNAVPFIGQWNSGTLLGYEPILWPIDYSSCIFVKK